MIDGDLPPGRNTARNTPDTLDGLEGALVRAFEGQTNAIRDEIKALGATLGGAVADLRAEARSTRLWVVGLLALAILVLGGIVGVSVALEVPGVGDVTTVGAP